MARKDWKKNILFSTKNVKTYQNRKKAERLEIINVSGLNRYKVTKENYYGYNRGFLVIVFDEARMGNILLKRHFAKSTTANKYARAYMRKY